MGKPRNGKRGVADANLTARLFGGQTDLSIDAAEEFVDERQLSNVISTSSASSPAGSMTILTRNSSAKASGEITESPIGTTGVFPRVGQQKPQADVDSAYHEARSAIFQPEPQTEPRTVGEERKPSTPAAPSVCVKRKVIMRRRNDAMDSDEFRR
jgi:hypothetical protein